MIMETMNDSNTKRSTEISLNSFIRWLTPTSKENEEKEKNDRRRIRTSSLMYSTAGSPRECWYSIFRKAMSNNNNKTVTSSSSNREVLTLDAFVLGMVELFQRTSVMNPPTRQQCTAIFVKAGSVRNILSRERFLRFFEDPRKEVGGLSKQGEMKRNVSRNDYSTTSSNSSSNIRSETVVSGSVFVHAMSIVLRHKRELKIHLEKKMQRRISMSRNERIKMISRAR